MAWVQRWCAARQYCIFLLRSWRNQYSNLWSGHLLQDMRIISPGGTYTHSTSWWLWNDLLLLLSLNNTPYEIMVVRGNTSFLKSTGWKTKIFQIYSKSLNLPLRGDCTNSSCINLHSLGEVWEGMRRRMWKRKKRRFCGWSHQVGCCTEWCGMNECMQAMVTYWTNY